VKLQTGSIVVFSPVALTPAVRSKLTSISAKPPTTYLIAPDIEHHMQLSSWASAFPSAHIIAPEGLAEKRAEMNKKDKTCSILDFATIFTAKNKLNTKVSEEFDAEFEYEFVDAHMNKELVFHHKPSKTLIEADLLFNLPATEQYSKTGQDANSGVLTKFWNSLNNTRGDAKWQKRMLWYVLSSSDRDGFGESMKRINAWGFENIVPCHGDTILGDGKGIFQKVAEWHLQGKKH
jgi:hypothetical protein